MKKGIEKLENKEKDNTINTGKDIREKKRQTDAFGANVPGVLSKDIGLNVKPPEKSCSSEHCPFHGHLKVRGKIFKGRIVSTKSTNTAIVEWDYYHYIQKYERYERRKTRISAHLPKCVEANVDDTVKIGECRPLSKTKRFVVIEKVK